MHALGDEHGGGGDRHEDDAERGRLPRVDLAGPAEEAEDRDGNVGQSARATKTVAPNSPSEIANANPAATREPREDERRGRSPAGRGRGDAPSTAAASRSALVDRAESRREDAHDERGRDERLCDRDERTAEPRRSSGGSSKAMTKPKPSMTADAASGSITSVSSQTPRRLAMTVAASPPTTSASAVAAAAKASEFTTVCHGGTSSVAVSSPSSR